jgi:hypothetical protein
VSNVVVVSLDVDTVVSNVVVKVVSKVVVVDFDVDTVVLNVVVKLVVLTF